MTNYRNSGIYPAGGARQRPLEDRVISISSSARECYFPRHISCWSEAMNPCPCGYFGDHLNNALSAPDCFQIPKRNQRTVPSTGGHLCRSAAHRLMRKLADRPAGRKNREKVRRGSPPAGSGSREVQSTKLKPATPICPRPMSGSTAKWNNQRRAC